MTKRQKRILLGSIAAIVLAFAGWFFSAYPRGWLAAQYDLARGHYEIEVYGYPAPGRWEYAALVEERYGVKVNAVAGCVVTQDLCWYVEAYNSVSEPRIQARFGKDIFAECWAETRAKHPLAP